MVRQPEIRYINAPVCGSAALQIATSPARKKVRLPKQHRAKKTVIAIDPLAVVSICVSAVLLVLLVVGFVRLQDARTEAATLFSYAETLQQENEQLKDTYTSGYDLEEIERIALAMGKVPASQVTTIAVSVQMPEVPQEPTAWETLCTFLTGLFA